MALPSRPTPTRQKGDYTFVYVKAPTEGSYTLCMQVTEGSGSKEAEMDEWRTIGSGKQREATESKYPVSLTLLVPENITEAARIIGTIKSGATWAGTEKLKIDPTKDIQFRFDDYTAAGVLTRSEYWDNVNWDKLERTTTSDGYRQWKLSGLAAEVYDTPAAL